MVKIQMSEIKNRKSKNENKWINKIRNKSENKKDTETVMLRRKITCAAEYKMNF